MPHAGPRGREHAFKRARARHDHHQRSTARSTPARRDVELYGEYVAELAVRQCARFVDAVRYWLDQTSDYAGRLHEIGQALTDLNAGRHIELPQDES